MTFKDDITSASAARWVKHLCLASFVHFSNYENKKETAYSDVLDTVLITKVERAGGTGGISSHNYEIHYLWHYQMNVNVRFL